MSQIIESTPLDQELYALRAIQRPFEIQSLQILQTFQTKTLANFLLVPNYISDVCEGYAFEFWQDITSRVKEICWYESSI